MTAAQPGPPDICPPVARALLAQGVPCRTFVHDTPPATIEAAAAERGQRPRQVVRSLLFRLGEGRFALVLVAGPAQVSWPALRRHFGQSRLSTATRDEVTAITGYEIGTVGPFGLRHAVEIVVDETVLAEDELSMGSGVRGTAVILARDDLLRALGPVPVGRFTKPAGDGEDRAGA